MWLYGDRCSNAIRRSVVLPFCDSAGLIREVMLGRFNLPNCNITADLDFQTPGNISIPLYPSLSLLLSLSLRAESLIRGALVCCVRTRLNTLLYPGSESMSSVYTAVSEQRDFHFE